MEAVDDGDYDTLSDLIKTSVRHELDDNFGFVENHTEQSNTQEVDVDLSGIEDRLDVLAQQISRVESDLGRVSDGDDEDIIDPNSDEFYRIQGEVENALPLVESEEQMKDLELAMELPISERARVTGYVSDIAAALDEPEDAVRQACMNLKEQKTRVQVIVDDSGKRRFFEVER